MVPVDDKVLAHCELLPRQAIGKHIKIHSHRDGLPSLDKVSMVILGVKESRNAFEKKTEKLDVSGLRIQLYKLLLGNWNSTLADIGDIEEGATVEDTYFVVRNTLTKLLEADILPIVIGATQDLTYPAYRSFDGIKNLVNLVAVDSRFDFGMDDELISSHSYMSKIITDKPNNLYNFSNIGYQSYFNAQEEMDLMDRLFFDAYRLGELGADITLAEPVLRNAHMISIDARAVRASEIGLSDNFSPNGFTGREICAIARYAGFGDKVSIFGMYEMENTVQSHQLMAQIIWYFIEGFNYRITESPLEEAENFTKYNVPCDSEQLVFHQSQLTERWWVEVPSILAPHTKSDAVALLPCTKTDYLQACDQIIPERWLKAYKKGFN